MSSLRTRLTVALSFAAGAFLYLSDHDTIDRHWRIALGLALGTVLLVLAPLMAAMRSCRFVWSGRLSPSTGRTARLLVVAIAVVAGSGCGTSRSVRAGAAGISTILGGVILQGGARGPSEDTGSSTSLAIVGAGLVALGGLLGLSSFASDPAPGPAPVQPFASLPAPAAPDHALLTRAALLTAASRR